MEEHKAIGVLDVPYLRPTMLGFMSDDEVVDDDIYTNKFGGYPVCGKPQKLFCGSCSNPKIYNVHYYSSGWGIQFLNKS